MATTVSEPATRVWLIELDAIVPNPFQPRQVFDEAELEDLADSLREHGLLQPIVVRPGALLSTGERGYYLISGERRWRAARIAGFAQIDAIVRDVEPLQAGILAAVENVQRVNMSPLEESDHIWRLLATAEAQGEKMTPLDLAKKLGKGRGVGYIQNRLDLRGMGADVQAMIAARPNSISHARLIDAVAKPEYRALLAEIVIEDDAPLTIVQELTRYLSGARSAASTEFLEELIDYYRQKRDFLKKSQAPLSARIDAELKRVHEIAQSQRAPDAQTQTRSDTNERTGGGSMSRGHEVTGPSAREATRELTVALDRAQTTLQSALQWAQIAKMSGANEQRVTDLKALVKALKATQNERLSELEKVIEQLETFSARN